MGNLQNVESTDHRWGDYREIAFIGNGHAHWNSNKNALWRRHRLQESGYKLRESPNE